MRAECRTKPLDCSATQSNIIADSGCVESTTEPVITFGRFRVLPQSRQFLANREVIEIGGRAFDLLITLLDSKGTIVSKNELLARVWPNTIVSESNLRVQIATLRKALGPDKEMIKSIPGRGYTLAEPIFNTSPNVSNPSQQALSRTLAPAPADGIAPHPSTTITQPTVVVIDDDAEIREALRGLMQSVGLNVAVFSSPRDFMNEASAAINCSCLVLDVRLPGRSGLDFYEDLVDANAEFPVIFMSGHADIPMSVRAMKAGAKEFLTKPVRHQDLLDAIQHALKTRERAHSADSSH